MKFNVNCRKVEFYKFLITGKQINKISNFNKKDQITQGNKTLRHAIQ